VKAGFKMTNPPFSWATTVLAKTHSLSFVSSGLSNKFLPSLIPLQVCVIKISFMNKLLLLPSIFLFLTLFANAQYSPGLPLTGRILNSKNEPLPHVSIAITKVNDSVYNKGALSTETGKFSTYLMEGSYTLKFTASGYQPALKNILISLHSNKNIEVVMLEQPEQLTVVIVKAQKTLIEHKIDKAILNVENSVLAAGSNALELLEQAPYVSVDHDGNISIRGNQGALVMIDGKQTFLSSSDISALLRNTPSNQVAKIEVITNPSSKYDAAGAAGVINIKLKKNLTHGLNGTTNFSLQQGRMPRWMEGVSLNYRRKKINLFGSVSYNRNERWNKEIVQTTLLENREIANLFSITENSFYYSHSVNVRAGFDYNISSKTIAGVVINYVAGKEDETAENTNNTKSITPAKASSLFTAHNGINRYSNYTANFNLKHQLDTSGRNISIDIDKAEFTDNSQPWYYSDFFDSYGTKTHTQVINGNMTTAIKIASAKADYEHLMTNNSSFSAGIKTSTVQTNNSIAYFINSRPDRNRSNDFTYKETINAFYADLAKDFKNLSVKLGFRGEQTISTGTQVTTDSSFTRKYFQLFPTAFIQYRWNTKHSLGITFNRRISRPDYESLNPFVYFSDPYTSWGGNPYLQPALTYGINLSHIYKNRLTVFVSANHTTEMVSQYQQRDTATGGIFSTQENLGKAYTFSAGISANLKPAKWWRLNSNVVIFRNVSKGMLGNVNTNTSITSFRVFLNNNVTLSKKLNAEAGFWYRPASLWGISNTGPLGNFSIGVQKKIIKGQGTIKLTVNDLFKMQKMKTAAVFGNLYTNSTAISENRAVRLGFSWNFGNKNVKSERERNNSLEDESGRIKGTD
jgi:iron complex outermembrane recepter protein